MNGYFKAEDLLSIDESLAGEFIASHKNPWEAIPHISEFIKSLIEQYKSDSSYRLLSDGVLCSKSARISDSASIGAPTFIGENAEIKQGAFIRGSALIGNGCVVGNSTEIKNSVLFNGAKAPHFNYVGDSILGHMAHLGAGAVTSNLKLEKNEVTVITADGKIPTEYKKLGSIIGDGAEIGCNCVLNPGTVIGRNANVYPLSSVRGYVPDNSIYKSKNEITEKEIRHER